ncbi:hypothetical protein Moror_5493 [Moniliophthora roreri MCA 2997]|uniref:Uncharacterized protein n=1 Tax=Moniliophthora roreri (strain MCA 2997) TaxID=1381753 RepID=V2WN18_MONRO|nr:hypothetical protein Moror_5493 [Moniliophthora roreri MCA 2997]
MIEAIDIEEMQCLVVATLNKILRLNVPHYATTSNPKAQGSGRGGRFQLSYKQLRSALLEIHGPCKRGNVLRVLKGDDVRGIGERLFAGIDTCCVSSNPRKVGSPLKPPGPAVTHLRYPIEHCDLGGFRKLLDYEGAQLLFIAAREGEEGLETSLGDGRGNALGEHEAQSL